jgi:hypothetical protein
VTSPRLPKTYTRFSARALPTKKRSSEKTHKNLLQDLFCANEVFRLQGEDGGFTLLDILVNSFPNPFLDRN